MFVCSFRSKFMPLPGRAFFLRMKCVFLSAMMFAASVQGEMMAEAEEALPPPLVEDPATPINQLFRNDPKPKITPRVLQRATPETTNIYISLTQQKAYLFVGKEVAIETPISSGRRAAMTPQGSFSIVEKSEKTQSNTYGDFVDKQGRVIRRGVAPKIDSAPSGTTFRPQPMRYFLRLNWTGLGLHAGHLPGYPASQVHVRFPEEIARLIFEHTQVGTPVVIGD
jgi:lipoprotein-anchoring transpeptidase ErfK/SrfK